jgi:O-succinylbenzoate synthase
MLKINNIKISRVGGLTEAKKIHNFCSAHQIPVWCGKVLESGIGSQCGHYYIV